MAHKTVGQTFRDACKDGNEEKVNAALVLMELGDINMKDAEGRTGLILVIKKGDENIVRILLARSDIDISVKDKDGHTPLHIAATEGNKLSL